MFLLDTHSLLWALFNAKMLSPLVATTIMTTDNLYISVASHQHRQWR